MISLRLLLVDDELEILSVQSEFFRNRGAVVETARDGREALEKAMALSPQAVVSDRMMPNRDGEWLAAEFKIRWPEIPFILQLGSFGESQTDTLMGLGVDAIVCKPAELDELTLLIERLVPTPSALWQKEIKLQRRAQHISIDGPDLVASLRTQQIAIGRRGLFIENRGWIGEPGAEVSLGAKGQQQPLLTGVVRWVRPIERSGLRPGIGLEIGSVRSDVGRQLLALLDMIRPQASIPLS
jgi:CheY-like chemotaxis protein